MSEQRMAQGMWDQMVGELEKQEGLLQAFQDDVYRIDRRAVGAIWAPDSKYLWLVRDYGSHLSRVGVGDGETEVEVALRTMQKELASRKHAIWLIETNASGWATIKSVSRETALKWCRWRQFETQDGTVRKDGKIVASVVTETVRESPGIWGFKLDITTPGCEVKRGVILAAYSHGVTLGTRAVGLFGKMRGATVNGTSVNNVAPVFEIQVQGLAPA